MTRRIAAGLALASMLAFGACSRVVVSELPIHVDNLTDTAIGVYVNGEWAGTYPPGATTVVPLGDHGGAPYVIEARSPAGGVLAAVEVNEASALALTDPAGMPVGKEVAVPCGIIRIVVGELGVDQTLSPAASVEPGPCP